MKKFNKVIMFIIIVCVLIIITCIIIFTKSRENNNENNNENNVINDSNFAVRESIVIEQVKDINITYNIEQTINDIIEKYHDMVLYNDQELNYTIPRSHVQSMQEFSAEELKVFNIEDAYEANINDNVTFYFTEGYLMYDDIQEAPEGDINKQQIKLILYRNKENDFYSVEQYGIQHQYLFKYNDDISKTGINDAVPDDILQWLEDELVFFKENSLEKEVSEGRIVSWYYNDYKNKKLFENQNREEYEKSEIYKITGDKEKGYTVTLNDGTKITIKPGNELKEYSVL